MKVCLFSDVHGNLPAMEKMLVHSADADLYISLGDVVNYGPWSNECVELLNSIKHKICIRGNHEDAFIKGNYPGKNEIAKAFFEFCYPSFDKKELIDCYQTDYLLNDFKCVHTIEDSYIYPDTELNLDGNYFIGHSHRQFITSSNVFRLCNTGSIGQNRVNINLINYAEYNTNSRVIDLKTIAYDSDIVIDKMIEMKYPKLCIDYYKSKQQ